jgi:hypothetical protein
MRLPSRLLVVLALGWLLGGCDHSVGGRAIADAGGAGSDGSVAPPDLGVPSPTGPLPPAPDDRRDGGPPGTLGDGGMFVPQPVDLGLVTHAPPAALAGVTVLGAGVDFRDVSTDEGGGVWGATSSRIHYWPRGASAPFTYDQSSGLARGQTSWTDSYWCAGDGIPCPATWSVSFTSVAGGLPGQVVVGNIGFIADRLDVDPATGAVRDVVGLQVTRTQHDDSTPAAAAELAAQQQREVASWKVALDLNGTFSGTAYLGGWHGLSALHGLGQTRTSALCGLGCYDYEEHVHAFTATDAAGRDVRAIAITPVGDLWVGDADVVWFLAQRSQGPYNDFFTPPPAIPGQSAQYLDVFPGVPDMVFGIAVDGDGGIWVASWGNGLARLAPPSYAPTYWSAADRLPESYLTGVAVDGSGDVWIATASAGVARYRPSAGDWSYYTTASGLPSDHLRAVYVDRYAASGRVVYFATDAGIAVYGGP